ncbi:MAG: GNAT family N-acetyltransferase [Devosia sp.]|uniref:GNAT family N-acetyltransferase n=1 Tax=Devosia sp. TaxID=1871048 RepID=UPI0024CBD630|nr:GNAT family N-acetyltransferase [Devosia sp.]UYN99912.1 MAG: GNAT family N-acetyltransferase [Devosia sp.]
MPEALQTTSTAAGIVLQTADLILRPWEDRDRAPMAAIQGDPLVRRYFPRVMTYQQVSDDIDLALEKARVNGFHTQAAELRHTGELVGLIGLGRIPDFIREAIPSRPQVEIGWVLSPRFWGRGLAPQGAAAWLDYAWSIGLAEVVATTAAVNVASRRVMEKIGMQYDRADDYQRPTFDGPHPARAHVVYRLDNPAMGAMA